MASSQKRHQIDHNSEHPKQFLTDSKRQQRQEECVASVDLGVVNGTVASSIVIELSVTKLLSLL